MLKRNNVWEYGEGCCTQACISSLFITLSYNKSPYSPRYFAAQ